jgi:hypothetical protein
MKKILAYVGLTLLTLIILFVTYFIIIRRLDNKAQQSEEVLPSIPHEKLPSFELASHFMDGERFYFKVPVANDDTLLTYGDTGGGICMLFPKAVVKGSFQTKLKTGILKGLMPIKYLPFEYFAEDPNFPIANPNSIILRNPFERITQPFLMVPVMEDEVKLMLQAQPEMDAFLGQTFFMDYAWTFDYPNQRILVNTSLHDSLRSHPDVQHLNFKKNSSHQKLSGHANLTIEVDGQTIDVLFDTGSTLVLTENGKQLLNTDRRTLGGSFIAASICNEWRKNHPEWKLYPAAEINGDIIEVPTVKICGHEVGPVLFAVRNDEAWSKGMAHSMDKVVKGAIGGSALKYFKVTADYNSELIRFERD